MLTAPLLVAVLLWPRAGFSMRDRVMAIGGAVWGRRLGAAAAGGERRPRRLPRRARHPGRRGLRRRRHAVDDAAAAGRRRCGAQHFHVAVGAPARWAGASSRWRRSAPCVPRGGRRRCCSRADRVRAVRRLPPVVPRDVTVRYALPLVVPVALLAVYAGGLAGARWHGRVRAVDPDRVADRGAAGVARLRPRRQPGVPGVRDDEEHRASSAATGPRPDMLAMHAVMRRVEEWLRDGSGPTVIRGAHGRRMAGARGALAQAAGQRRPLRRRPAPHRPRAVRSADPRARAARNAGRSPRCRISPAAVRARRTPI